jgi:hypothetical protein
MELVKRGCAVGCAAVAIAFLALLLWPYRLETIESLVSQNETGCSIFTTSVGGWNTEPMALGLKAERVAYPLDVRVFIVGCDGVPEGRPYSAELVCASAGAVITRGQSCADAGPAEGIRLCRLELPPLATLTGQDRYLVRVAKRRGDTPRTASIRLYLFRTWRSVVLAAIGSV